MATGGIKYSNSNVKPQVQVAPVRTGMQVAQDGIGQPFGQMPKPPVMPNTQFPTAPPNELQPMLHATQMPMQPGLSPPGGVGGSMSPPMIQPVQNPQMQPGLPTPMPKLPAQPPVTTMPMGPGGPNTPQSATNNALFNGSVNPPNYMPQMNPQLMAMISNALLSAGVR